MKPPKERLGMPDSITITPTANEHFVVQVTHSGYFTPELVYSFGSQPAMIAFLENECTDNTTKEQK